MAFSPFVFEKKAAACPAFGAACHILL